MKINKILILFFTAYVLNICNGYRILGIYAHSGKSHFNMINQLFKGLARKGHQVDVITPFPQKEKYPNYTQIFTFPGKTSDFVNNIDYEVVKQFKYNSNLSVAGDIGYAMCENMGIPEFLRLAKNPPTNPPYDVIITQMFSAHCFNILGHLWNIPVVLASTAALYPWMHDMIGNPENIAFSSNNLSPIIEGNGLWSRIFNAYKFYVNKFSYLYYTRNQNELLKKYFGPDAPSIRELEQSVSLVLMNTYFPINGVKPMATGVIEVGGLHIQNDGPEITDSLKRWLDDSKDGVIYFNLGTLLRIEIFPEETIKAIFESLAKLSPMRILIKVVRPEELKIKLPDNFKALSWIPQEKVLQHPNVKLFITHAGLLGTQESIYYGVPMFCLPVFADQYTNTHNYVQKKIAVTADIMSLTKEKFEKTLNEIIKNPIYRNNVKKISRVFKDRPMNAMDTAAFWIEFVVRNGKNSLRSPAMDLTWWQVALLDVYAVVFVVFLIIIYIAVFVIKAAIGFFLNNTSKTVPKNKKIN